MAGAGDELVIEQTGPDFMLDELERYMRAAAFSDLSIQCGSGGQMSRRVSAAHCAVLAAVSPFLKKLVRLPDRTELSLKQRNIPQLFGALPIPVLASPIPALSRRSAGHPHAARHFLRRRLSVATARLPWQGQVSEQPPRIGRRYRSEVA